MLPFGFIFWLKIVIFFFKNLYINILNQLKSRFFECKTYTNTFIFIVKRYLKQDCYLQNYLKGNNYFTDIKIAPV